MDSHEGDRHDAHPKSDIWSAILVAVSKRRDETLYPDDIATAVGADETIVQDALDSMVDSGWLVRDGEGGFRAGPQSDDHLV